MPQALESLVQELIYPPPPLKTTGTRMKMNTSGPDFFKQVLSNVQVSENPFSHLLEEEEIEQKRKQSLEVVNKKPFEGGFDTESSDRNTKMKKKKPPSQIYVLKWYCLQ